ncbi:LAETG motif-containing sortase-dependent surface protein [Streptomyces enissocaesilis]|uniref:Gram-positive cocci surface proteins LPxTG domain-containing protein n=1 Tax=Streptomyces enissocaesilis TaxID=332589 RepID=A0ABN3XCT9_9ACTN
MRFRRILATAAVAAVTTPVALLSATPAFADTRPAAQEQLSKPGIAQLEKAAAEAQKAYDDAVLAEKEGKEDLEAALADTTPLAVAATAAVKAAKEAEAAKAAADKALADAEDKLDELPATATPEEKEAAEKAVTDAEAAAKAAAGAKTAADAEAETALDARDDARVAAVRQYELLKQAVKKALEDKTAADEALAEAREEEDEEGNEGEECVPEPDLTTVVTGLPSKVVAGDWVDFRLRLTNGTEKTMDEVYPYADVHATDKSGLEDIGDLLKLQWSSASSTTWKPVDDTSYIDPISPLEAGAHSDIKLRLKIDAKAPAGQGMAFASGDYSNDDESCGGTPDPATYEFEIAAGTPGKTPDATPAPSATPAPATTATPSATPAAVIPTPQGGVSHQPVSGSLANTGSSSAVPQIALVGGAAVLAGAGAMFVVRRRKAGSAA